MVQEILPILAVETSGESCSACLYFNDKKYLDITLRQKNVHSEKLLQIIDQILVIMETRLSDIKVLAISAGPGSFTGLRIGMSAVKGLAFGSSLPIVPVPTFQALALQISSLLTPGTPFIISNKVNVEETYFAVFKSGLNDYSKEEDIKVIRNDEFGTRIKQGIAVYGNSVPVSESEFIHKELSVPTAYWIAKWAYRFGKDLVSLDYDFLEPAYFKNFIVR